MPRKKPKISPEEKLRRVALSGLHQSDHLEAAPLSFADGDVLLIPLSERIVAIKSLFQRFSEKKITDMLFFISYDIEDNKVRTHIAKYLLRKGCTRLQKSVYFGSAKREEYHHIVNTLHEVQAMYQNEDSIFVLPVGEDNIHKMEVIGQNLSLKLEINPGSTFFF